MKCISYKSGYKYQLKTDYFDVIRVIPSQPIRTEYITLSLDGTIKLFKGYAWDGPSGPSIDTLNSMRGSLVHDALYQLIRDGYLAKGQYRSIADKLLKKICRQDGMSALRAWLTYQGARLFGDPSADPASSRPIIKAPASCQ